MALLAALLAVPLAALNSPETVKSMALGRSAAAADLPAAAAPGDGRAGKINPSVGRHTLPKIRHLVSHLWYLP